jgi:hypothetical protein
VTELHLQGAAAGARIGRSGCGSERGSALHGGGVDLVQEIGLARVRIGGGSIFRGQLAAAPQEPQDEVAHPADDARDVGIGEFAGRVEVGARLPERAREHAVRKQAVEVQVESGRRIGALVHDHGAGAGARQAEATCSAPVEARHRAHQDGANGAADARVVGAEQTDGVRQRQHPLAEGHVGEHFVDQERRGVGHAARAARGTEPATLARERDQLVPAAGIAMEPTETAREHATVEECAQFAFDEVWQRAAACVVIGDACAEGLQVLLQDLVQHGLFRPTADACLGVPHARSVRRVAPW